MGKTFSIRFNNAAFDQALRGVEKQIRFASAVALTHTAKDAQAEVRKQFPQRFTQRTGWVPKGIQISAANKSNLKSSVRVMDHFMALQESGGIKKPQLGKVLGVPVGARPTPKSITRPSRFPGALLKKKGYFIAPITKRSLTARSGGTKNTARRLYNKSITTQDLGRMALWRRRGKKRLPIDLIYIFKESVTIKPRFRFKETVRDVALERFPKRFLDALQKALETAR